MNSPNRRRFLRGTLAATAGGWTLCGRRAGANDGNLPADGLRIGTFRFDVTPPMGHPCCGGWIKPVVGVDDPLEALGLVITGAGKPIVVCAVDWTGLLNEAHVEWRRALAEAAGTTPDRVAVQCLHQHNAPLACLEAERIVQTQSDLPHIVGLDFFAECLGRGKKAVAEAMEAMRPLTHIAHGQAKVEKVASNRRVYRDADGRVKAMRGSSCRNAELRALPEGLIDPWLKTVAFYDKDQKIAACHYYATHPMSYYGDGRASSDFVGLARKQRQKDEPDCMHIYFTGCGGNVAAGKYNDGSKEMRPILTARVYDGIVRSEEGLKPVAIDRAAWKTCDIIPPPRASFSAESLQKQIGNKASSVAGRSRPAFMLSLLRRVEKQIPLVVSALHMNNIRMLNLPSEGFVQYQLRAQKMQPGGFVATAGYGDEGPWYIPVKEEYSKGGYEVSVAFCDPEIDPLLTEAMKEVLG